MTMHTCQGGREGGRQGGGSAVSARVHACCCWCHKRCCCCWWWWWWWRRWPHRFHAVVASVHVVAQEQEIGVGCRACAGSRAPCELLQLAAAGLAAQRMALQGACMHACGCMGWSRVCRMRPARRLQDCGCWRGAALRACRCHPPAILKISNRSWNCPCVSPTTTTGAFTCCTLLSRCSSSCRRAVGAWVGVCMACCTHPARPRCMSRGAGSQPAAHLALAGQLHHLLLAQKLDLAQLPYLRVQNGCLLRGQGLCQRHGCGLSLPAAD